MPLKHPKSRFGSTIPKKQRQKRQKTSGSTQSRNGTKSPTQAELDQLNDEEKKRYLFTDINFPDPMTNSPFYGLAGDIVGHIYPESEASREALLLQLLVGLGSVIGSGPFREQSGQHRLNEFLVLVGPTSFGRKGTSWNPIEKLLALVDPVWFSDRIASGIQSGEKVIELLDDSSVIDKRLLLLEEEFARLLKVAAREKNILSDTLRRAWENRRYLQTQSLKNPFKATRPHISLIGHVTREDLLKHLADVENENGFSNRIMWSAAKRSKVIAIPQEIDWRAIPGVLPKLHTIVAGFQPLCRIDWSLPAKKLWNDFYHNLPEKASGFIGKISARSSGHVLRLAMIYTVLEDHQPPMISVDALQAAIAIWQYLLASARYVFGQTTGDKNADKIYLALRREPSHRLARHQVRREVFHDHISKLDLDSALAILYELKLADFNHEVIPGSDRPIQFWFQIP
jgi:hypothetical protein